MSEQTELSSAKKTLLIISLLPLVFNWLIGLTLFPRIALTRQQCIQWGALSSAYLAGLIVLWVLQSVPFVGYYFSLAGFFVAFVWSLAYLALSGWLIYNLVKQKPVVLPQLEPVQAFFAA